MKPIRDLAEFFAVEGPRLRNYLRRWWPNEAAEDLAQDAFERFCAADASEVRSPRAYLFQIARNLAVNARKRALAVKFELVGDPSMLDLASEAPNPEDEVIAGDLLERLYAALHELPERQRQALILFKLEGCSYKEIGERMGVSPRSVERYVADALAHCHTAFRALMADDDV